ncbi:MAG: response regulator [Acidobacteria bacterium]|nr:response regulator [Acidobacteriota bacterium]MBV9477858.1 response regulator [Acidobacteriota bacterium]
MSLLGRLEDLSLTDIVQIVYLSRRTGVLEIIDSVGRHTVLFRSGLVVNAASPQHPDLVSFLEAAELISHDKGAMLRQMEERGISAGLAALDLNFLSKDDLANAIRQRILSVVTPLLQSKEGEFNFILSDAMSALDVEYDPDQLFKEGGFAPNRLLGGADGEKLKPLKGLEESLKVGKALLRGSAPAEATPASLNLGLGQPLGPVEVPAPPPEPATPANDNVVRFPTPREEFTPIDELPEGTGAGPLVPPDHTPALSSTSIAASGAGSGQFKVAGGLFEIESPDAAYRNVVLFERNPLVRVAARRAFTKWGVKIFQYGSLDDVRSSMTDLFRSNSFFVTFLELTDDDASVRLMQQVKRKNPRLPVVLVDSVADLRRRHALLRAGADLYLTKPSPARLQPGLVEEELALFADELVLFADRSFQQYEQMTGGLGPEAGKKFYEQATKETIDRSFGLLRQLINELSNPNDIGEVSATILRLSAEYLDRGALFMTSDDAFVGLGGFGRAGAGGGDELDARVRNLRVPRNEPSILSDVVEAGAAHHGKMRRTPANVDLIEKLGGLLPTEVVALPILHANRAIGILYGDNAEHRAPIDSMTGLEIFLSQAGYAFGNAVFASERAGRR